MPSKKRIIAKKNRVGLLDLNTKVDFIIPFILFQKMWLPQRFYSYHPKKKTTGKE